jgi:hypothetical protein
VVGEHAGRQQPGHAPAEHHRAVPDLPVHRGNLRRRCGGIRRRAGERGSPSRMRGPSRPRSCRPSPAGVTFGTAGWGGKLGSGVPPSVWGCEEQRNGSCGTPRLRSTVAGHHPATRRSCACGCGIPSRTAP